MVKEIIADIRACFPTQSCWSVNKTLQPKKVKSSEKADALCKQLRIACEIFHKSILCFVGSYFISGTVDKMSDKKFICLSSFSGRKSDK